MTEQLDQQYMQHALALAKKAESVGEVPVGAVIVSGNAIIGTGYNQPISHSDPSAHAEIIALRDAAQAINNYRLVNTTMYVTLEPCAMCAGAMVHARVGRLVFAASDLKTGAAGSVFTITHSDKLNHKIKVESGLCEAESRELLQAFFAARR